MEFKFRLIASFKLFRIYNASPGMIFRYLYQYFILIQFPYEHKKRLQVTSQVILLVVCIAICGMKITIQAFALQ